MPATSRLFRGADDSAFIQLLHTHVCQHSQAVRRPGLLLDNSDPVQVVNGGLQGDHDASRASALA